MTSLETTKIKSIVMRRVWYSFFVDLFFKPALGLGMIFGASLMLLKELVFVERVLASLLKSGLTGLPSHLLLVLRGADWFSLALFLILVSLSIYFLRVVLVLIKQKFSLRSVAY